MYKIDYEKIRENISTLNDTDYIVLKSNAYGFGFNEVLQIAISCGIYKFIVIDIKDALNIKKYYSNTRVLLLGPIDKHNLLLCEKYSIEVTVNKLEDIYLLDGYKINVQIEINSGMNRFGIRPHELNQALVLLKKANKNVTGIFSHNATKIPSLIATQLNSFYKLIINKEDIDIHYSSSSLKDYVITNQKARRIGEFIYQTALTVYGKIIQINHVYKGEYIGYDYAYKMENDGYIGIVNIGYADGLERKCHGFLVNISGKYYPLIGRACMNHCFVLIDDENYLPNILRTLWKINGRENVHQPSRYVIHLPGQQNVSDLVVDDPHENLKRRNER